MDADERRLLVERKLQANRQRRDLGTLLQSLPDGLARVLEPADKLFRGEEDTTVHFAFAPELGWPEETDGLYKGSDRPQDYFYKRFGWEHKLIEALDRVPRVHSSKPAYFFCHPTNLALPIFRLPLGQLHVNLKAFALNLTTRFHIASVDGQQGIYSSDYLSYLPEDWSPEETVYELTIYGHGKIRM